MVGTIPSMTKALFPANEEAAPGAGKVRSALLLALSVIVPPLSERAAVEI